jgi:hypothetical protein
MNMLEIYIEEVHSEKPYIAEWTKEFPEREFVLVEVSTNCYGSKKRETHIWSTKEWAKYQEQGYYMG